MTNEDEVNRALNAIAQQATAYEKRANSQVEKQYSNTMQSSAATLARFARTASFDQLILAEKALQQNDLLVYAQRPATIKSVQEGIDDFKDGEQVYRQLLENTEAYKAHKYRKKTDSPPKTSSRSTPCAVPFAAR